MNGRNRQSTLSSLTSYIPLPKYFDSEWSYAQFRIPTQSSHISLSQQTNRNHPDADAAEEEKCTVGWIEAPSTQENNTAPRPLPADEFQLIALTYTGSWYRLSLPNSAAASSPLSSPIPTLGPPSSVRSHHTPRTRSISGSSFTNRVDKAKGKEQEKEKKESRDCVLLEFRRFGRWDGWS